MSSFAYAVAIAIAVALSWDKVMRPVQRRCVDSDVAEHLMINGWSRPDDICEALAEHAEHEVRESIDRMCECGWVMFNGTRLETQTIGITREGEKALAED
jgi:hypothetical protein